MEEIFEDRLGTRYLANGLVAWAHHEEERLIKKYMLKAVPVDENEDAENE